MKTCHDLYEQLTSYENLELAFDNARKGKTLKDYVIEFEVDLKQNLLDLQFELQTFTYRPRPITTFIVKDPKTRKIGASDFRDRVIHHALCNIISPILGSTFIFDSFANRKGKGTHPAIKRFEDFLRAASGIYCFIFCCDGHTSICDRISYRVTAAESLQDNIPATIRTCLS